MRKGKSRLEGEEEEEEGEYEGRERSGKGTL